LSHLKIKDFAISFKKRGKKLCEEAYLSFPPPPSYGEGFFLLKAVLEGIEKRGTGGGV
jgi:hypothetical protein